ncbi:MAG TPA: hypothetical protein VFE12_02295, partial [Acetobacteraceae bacterium]|nr:hypothetical protein [Acetobacteraceae bacterium]
DLSVRHLKKFGADLKWVIFDAPMNGHDYHGPRACNYSIEETVRRMGATIAEIRTMYPAIKLGWTQVPNRVDRSFDAWLAELRAELAAYRQVTGTPLDALMLDMNYYLPGWEACIRQSADILHQNGTAAGVFLNARGGRDVTDQSWMDEARQHAEALAANQFALDYVIVASWQRHPARLLPDNDPLALTSLLNHYQRAMGQAKGTQSPR